MQLKFVDTEAAFQVPTVNVVLGMQGVADPNLQIRGAGEVIQTLRYKGGGGGSEKKFFLGPLGRPLV